VINGDLLFDTGAEPKSRVTSSSSAGR